MTRVSRAESNLWPSALAFRGEPTTLGVCKAQVATAEPLLEDPILFLQVLDDIELTAVDPAAEQEEEQLDHPGRVLWRIQ